MAAVNGVTFGFSDFGVSFREVNVFKERAGAGLDGGIGEFVGADDGDDVTNTGWRSIGKIVFG